MVEINGSLFIQIINFLVLIWVLNKVLYKPVRNIIAQRKARVSGLEEVIDHSEQDIFAKDEALKAGLKAAREKGLKEKEASENEARQQEKKLMEKINEKTREDLAEIRERVVKEAQTTRLALQNEIESFADQISHKILGRAV
jgi:F-type H+-transporting ATPase subunit b